MLSFDDVIRLELGYHTWKDQKIVICGFLIRHPEGPLLMDTGITAVDAETEAEYHPVGRSLEEALRGHGVEPGEVRMVVNCHLHADHCGANSLFPGVPIVVQAAEREAAREPGYTTPGLLDFDGANLQLIEGEVELLPGIRALPTPGHTPGHQSLAVATVQGTVVLGGQAFNSISEFAQAWFARRLATSGEEPGLDYPPWLDRIQQLDPRRVLLAHDLAIWEAATP